MLHQLAKSGFHGYVDNQIWPHHYDGGGQLGRSYRELPDTHIETYEFDYDFDIHYHPYVSELLERLIQGSVDGLQAADTEVDESTANGSGADDRSYALVEEFFEDAYAPNPDIFEDDESEPDYPVENLNFKTDGAYATYNWELFYHVPMTIAMHLSNNQRYEEAMRWFHYIFDPTDDSDAPTPERFWKVKPFRTTEVHLIEDILYNMASGQDADLRKETMATINAWEASPFEPHVVARHRTSAYMMRTVMAYLDNLIAWGDSLFREDTIESINEATQLYVLASNILGPRPQSVPREESVANSRTYAEIRKNLREDDTARELENAIRFNEMPPPSDGGGEARFSMVATIGRTLYFCLPRNEKLLGYWDMVADRLFKIHNSLNIEGVFRQLPLYEPPIDPGAIAKAKAAGVDVSSAVSAANQPVPKARYRVLAEKARAICNDLKSLGGQLQSALEKEDSERLSMLRAEHERAILEKVESVRYGQYKEAQKSREGIEASIDKAFDRYAYYEQLLGKSSDELELPKLPDLDPSAIEEMDVDLSEPELDLRDLDIQLARESRFETGGHNLIKEEAKELEKMEEARDQRATAATLQSIGSALALVPQFKVLASPLGVGGAFGFGGQQLSQSLRFVAQLHRHTADKKSYQARRKSKMGGYERREQQWAFQSRSAAGEINQLFKRYRAAQLREELAKQELENHRQKIENAREIEQFLTEAKKGQTTNADFYKWMKREVKGLYNECYQLALDVGKKAERALQHEIGDEEVSFLEHDYQSGKQGLLAGEKMSLDLQRMDVAYHEQREREYEIEKHISLRKVAPAKLLALRETGECTVALPEELFDMDVAGHYFRRIKSVAVSIPSVTGPYTSVNCTLRLQKSRVRTTPEVGTAEDAPNDYVWRGVDDSRFDHHFGNTESIVTSTAQNDDGMFQTNLEGERYLPFEGEGAISTWRLELPELEQFDYDTIQDVVLHMRYTAREGGETLRSEAHRNLEHAIPMSASPDDSQTDREPPNTGAAQLRSFRHDFPDEWAQFQNADAGDQWPAFTAALDEMHYPFWTQRFLEKADVTTATIVARLGDATSLKVSQTETPDDGPTVELSETNKFGSLVTATVERESDDSGDAELLPSSPTDDWTLYFEHTDVEDIWVILSTSVDWTPDDT